MDFGNGAYCFCDRFYKLGLSFVVCNRCSLRPVLIQCIPSVVKGPLPFAIEARIVLLTRSKKSLFNPNFLTEQSDWHIQSKKPSIRLGVRVGLLSRNVSPIASFIPPRNTHPHAHTPIPGTIQQYTTAQTLAWLLSLLLFAASQRGTFLAPPASSVYFTTAAARRICDILPTTATLSVLWRLPAECDASNAAQAAFG